jgi:fructose-bisphosphate aldolase class II
VRDGKELRNVYDRAKDEKYAFIASNFAEPNILIGLIKGSNRVDSDIVLQLSRSACEFAGDGNPVAGLRTMGNYIENIADKYQIGVFLNMDHLKDMEFIEKAIDTGLPSSVMIDASDKSFEDNVEISGRVKEKAREKDILVEAELGKIKGVEDKVASEEAFYTKPDEAVEFVQKTNCDLLAISVGTQHGVSKGEDIDLRLDIAQKVNQDLTENGIKIPLVIHGSSGLFYEQLKRLIGEGVCKFNKDTRYQYEYTKTAFEFYRGHEDEILPPEGSEGDVDGFFSGVDWTPQKKYFDPRISSRKIRERISQVIENLAKMSGSAGNSLYK